MNGRIYDPLIGRMLSADIVVQAPGNLQSFNRYAYVMNRPLTLVDPSGYETYRLNRELNPKDRTTREPVKHVFSHTFVFTTNKDGSLKDTYSWGNTYDASGNAIWHQNRPEDVSAASSDIATKSAYDSAPWYKRIFMNAPEAEKVGDDALDPKVDQAFKDRRANPKHSSYHKWKLFNNCKHEATRLANDAKRKVEAEQQAQAAAQAAAQSQGQQVAPAQPPSTTQQPTPTPGPSGQAPPQATPPQPPVVPLPPPPPPPDPQKKPIP